MINEDERKPYDLSRNKERYRYRINREKPKPYDPAGFYKYCRDKALDKKVSGEIDRALKRLDFREGIDGPRPYDLGHQAKMRQVIDDIMDKYR